MILEIIGKVFYFFYFFEIFSKKLIYFLHFENPLFKGKFLGEKWIFKEKMDF